MDGVTPIRTNFFFEAVSKVVARYFHFRKPKGSRRQVFGKSQVTPHRIEDQPQSKEDRHQNEDQKPMLLLYFDVNQTVIMCDPVQGKTAAEVVNDVLADTTRGIVENGEWKWNHMDPTSYTLGGKETIRYSEYVSQLLPTPDSKQGKKEVKKARKELKTAFAKPGAPGERLHGVYEELLGALKLPQELVGLPAAVEAGLTGDTYNLLPSFFHLLLDLKRRKRRFRLVFRTYGVDLEGITKELNAFCEGRHPLYPGVRLDGSDGEPDYRVNMQDDPWSFGTFFRHGEDEVSLVMGSITQFERDTAHLRPTGLAEYEAEANTHLIHTWAGIHSFLGAHLQTRGSLALRDDFAWWAQHGEAATAGKPLLLDPSDLTVHPMFFDDNIQRHDAHIVDVRDVRTGAGLALERTLGTYIRAAHPLDAIRDPQYYIHAVRACEMSREMHKSPLQQRRSFRERVRSGFREGASTSFSPQGNRRGLSRTQTMGPGICSEGDTIQSRRDNSDGATLSKHAMNSSGNVELVIQEQPLLLLFFAVNKTITLGPVGEGGMQVAINRLLAEGAQGEVSSDGREWRWDGRPPFSSSPVAAAEASPPPLVSYTAFMDSDAAMPINIDDTGLSGDGAKQQQQQQDQQKQQQKMARGLELLSHFVEPGAPGEGMAGLGEQLCTALRLPPPTEDGRGGGGGLQEEATGRNATEEGKKDFCCVHPSFLALLQELCRQGRRFRLVFRPSQAEELHPAFVAQFNAFCEGRHPLFPEVRLDGTAGGMDYRLSLQDPLGCGVMRRGGGGAGAADSVSLLMGDAHYKELSQRPDQSAAAAGHDAQQAAMTDAQGIHTWAGIHSFLGAHLQTRGSLALRDDFAWWAQHGEAATAGKPLLLDPSDLTVHPMLFDDNNSSRHDAHIVDVRDVRTGAGLALERTLGTYIRAAHPLDAIRDPQYYIHAVRACEMSRASPRPTKDDGHTGEAVPTSYIK